MRHTEHRIVDGVESPEADLRAEVRLDLSREKVLVIPGWSVGVVEATESAIRFVPARTAPRAP
jgi:hypothetical protein